jgi:hypothetical protein
MDLFHGVFDYMRGRQSRKGYLCKMSDLTTDVAGVTQHTHGEQEPFACSKLG